MQRILICSLIVIPSLFVSAQAEEVLQNITSNNFQSASSTVSQSYGAWALPNQNLDIKSIWFNPAMMTYQGQQSSINLFNQPSGSIFFKAYNQNIGIHLGRTSQYTSDFDINNEIDSYDLFWAKGEKGNSIGVNTYFSFDGNTDVARTTFEGQDLQGTTNFVLDNSPDSDTVNTIEVVIDKNRAGTNEFDIGANIGIDKGLKQYIINIEVSESTGVFDNFKGSVTTTNGTTVTENKENTVGTSLKNTRFTIGGSYIEKKDKRLFIITGVKFVYEINADETYAESEIAGTHTILHRKSSQNSAHLNLTGGAQLDIKPSARITYSIQQLLNLGIAMGSNKLDIIRDLDGATNEATGLEEQSKTLQISLNAPILVSMNMQATTKLNMTASVQSNALNLAFIKETELEMEVIDNSWVETGNDNILKNEFFRQTTSNTSVAWGLSYQFSNQLVFDFNVSSDFLTDGITDSSILNELTITYQF
ncbi:MAG: hypothetical protein HRU38_07375 [Saccharospirillaceae bacterium]|nr:hypothetical protein [Pseudomonadales bacterium]NRB78473.1 hypothetical protein [Saccharospirillaceae bacterium]